MDGSTTIDNPLPSFRSPPRILIPKLVHSRDRWKQKAAQRKRELKQAQIRSRDLALSRQRWKERALDAEQQTQSLQQQLDQAHHLVEQARAEVAHLQEEEKKRLSLPT
jgi:CHASE3 domain sensor protein